VAGTLAHTSRHDDEVIRWGGEEFLVLVADADYAALGAAAERLRALVKQSRLFAGGQPVQLTISLGGTFVAPGDTAERVVRRADALMYQSKAAGRDRVTLDCDEANWPRSRATF
jgi:diguanylate cyclase (GGDEF)-like protein